MIRIVPSSKVRLAAAAVLAVPAVAACALLVFAHTLQSANKEASISPESRALVRQAIASTGLISVRNSSDSSSQGPRPRGSAVVVRSDGVLVTNYHVITNPRTIRAYDEIFLRWLLTNSQPRVAVVPLTVVDIGRDDKSDPKTAAKTTTTSPKATTST